MAAKPIDFEVKSNLRELIDQYRDELGDAAIRSALASAINKSMTAAKREHIKQMQAKYNITNQKGGFNIQKEFKVVRANPQKSSSKSGKGVLEARAYMKSPRWGVYKFEPQKTENGTSVDIKKQRKNIRSAFVAEVKSGRGDGSTKAFHLGVFRRIPGSSIVPSQGSYAGRRYERGPRKGQLLRRAKIVELFTTTPAAAIDIANPDIGMFVDDKLYKLFEEALIAKQSKKNASAT